MAHFKALNVARRISFPYKVYCRKVLPAVTHRTCIFKNDSNFIHSDGGMQHQCLYSTSMMSYSPHVGHSQFRTYSVQSNQKSSQSEAKQEVCDAPSAADSYEKLSLFQKFKAMYRNYWYVLVPVHLSSSIVFLGVFYYAASSGVDIVAMLEKLNVSESIINPLRDSSAGYIAITYALYKIFTPIRYTVTLGGTTWAIKLLTARGLIKPRPMKEAKENVQNIITAMKMPENQRQKFLEDKGMPRLGKAVGHASNKSPFSGSSNKDQLKK